MALVQNAGLKRATRGSLKYRTQKIVKNSLSSRHRTTLSGYIVAIKARIDNWKNLLSSNISSRCPHNIVNFGPLAAKIGPVVWGTPAKFQQLSCLGSVTARHSSSGHQQNIVALNRGRHLYSTGRPSRSALAHILSLYLFARGIMYYMYYIAFNTGSVKSV